MCPRSRPRATTSRPLWTLWWRPSSAMKPTCRSRGIIMADIIRVDLATGAASAAPLAGDLAGLGGRGLTSALVAAEVNPTSDPMGPDNLLVVAAGILAGTSVPNSGRISVGAKSPLTGTIKEANAGGQTARKLANLGARAIAMSGAAPELSLIEVDAEGCLLYTSPSPRDRT